MPTKPKLIYRVDYKTTKKFSSEIVAEILNKAATYDPTPVNKHIVLQKNSSDDRGNSTFELYKEALSPEEQDLYNRFFNMMRSHENYTEIHPDWTHFGCYCYCYSEREIQDLYLTLRNSK